MSNKKFQSVLIGTCLCSLVVGCGGSSVTPGAKGTRRGVSDPITITMSQAPAEWETLEAGATILSGLIEADNGLNPANHKTLVIAVEDLRHGFVREYKFISPDAEAPNSSLDYNTGAFFLDLTNDFRLVEGLHEIRLQVQDALGFEKAWVRRVRVTPWYPDWSWEALANSKQLYGIELLRYVQRYNEFMQLIIERGVDPAAFPFIDLDIALGQQFEALLMDMYIAHPSMASWDQLSDEHFAAFESLLSDGAPFNVLEQEYRDDVKGRAVMLDILFSSPARARRDYQLFELDPGQPRATASNRRLWDEAFFRNVFSTATVAEDGNGALVFHGALFANDGLVVTTDCCTERPPFVEPTPNSWQDNDPVFEVIATAIDSDADGLLDKLLHDGLRNGQTLVDDVLREDEQIEHAPYLQEGLPSLGHLVTPLSHLTLTEYFKTD